MAICRDHGGQRRSAEPPCGMRIISSFSTALRGSRRASKRRRNLRSASRSAPISGRGGLLGPCLGGGMALVPQRSRPWTGWPRRRAAADWARIGWDGAEPEPGRKLAEPWPEPGRNQAGTRPEPWPEPELTRRWPAGCVWPAAGLRGTMAYPPCGKDAPMCLRWHANCAIHPPTDGRRGSLS